MRLLNALALVICLMLAPALSYGATKTISDTHKKALVVPKVTTNNCPYVVPEHTGTSPTTNDDCLRGGGGGGDGGGGFSFYTNSSAQSYLDAAYGEGNAASADSTQLPGITINGPPLPTSTPILIPGADSEDVGFYKFPLVAGGGLYDWAKQKIDDWMIKHIHQAEEKNLTPRTAPLYTFCHPLMKGFNNAVSNSTDAEEAGNAIIAILGYNKFATRDVEVPFGDGGIGTFRVVQNADYHLMVSVTPPTHPQIISACPQ